MTLMFVYGGSSSGKSTFAEQFLQGVDAVSEKVYIATMVPGGREARQRIARHRLMRAHKGFSSYERYTDIEGLALPENSAVLLECLGNLVANEMFQQGGAGEKTEEAILRGIVKMAAQTKHLVIVSNEVCCDGVQYDEGTTLYQETLASLNHQLCSRSDCAVELVCGIPVFLKGEELCGLSVG